MRRPQIKNRKVSNSMKLDMVDITDGLFFSVKGVIELAIVIPPSQVNA